MATENTETTLGCCPHAWHLTEERQFTPFSLLSALFTHIEKTELKGIGMASLAPKHLLMINNGQVCISVSGQAVKTQSTGGLG